MRDPSDDWRYELVAGRLISMSPPAFRHGLVVTRVLALLLRHAEANNLGAVVPEVGFKLASNPDTVRAPDVAFVRRDRIPSKKGFMEGPPDLAVEVLSPDDRPSEVQAKVSDYLTREVMLVLVIDPDELTATIHRRLTPPVTLSVNDVVNLDDVVSGFQCRVQDIFERT
jgi:Uma2 family endonuclease